MYTSIYIHHTCGTEYIEMKKMKMINTIYLKKKNSLRAIENIRVNHDSYKNSVSTILATALEGPPMSS